MHFTSMWVDASSTLPFRRRQRMLAEHFLPVLEDVSRRFTYDGPGAAYYRRAIPTQIRNLAAPSRLRAHRYLFSWEERTGAKPAPPRAAAAHSDQSVFCRHIVGPHTHSLYLTYSHCTAWHVLSPWHWGGFS